MAYSVTDKKRIRKSFATRQKVLDVPYVLAIQKDSYAQFLQKDVPSKKRKNQGLQAAFILFSLSSVITVLLDWNLLAMS